jgi:predicted transcriptional regulator
MSDCRYINDLIVLDLPTHDPLSGNVCDADAPPTAEVFEDEDDTAMCIPAVAKRTGKTGDYRVSIMASAANGFEVGKSYNVIAVAIVNDITRKVRVGSFTLDSVRNAALDDKATLVKAQTDKIQFAAGNDIKATLDGELVALLDTEVAKSMRELSEGNTRRQLILATSINVVRNVAIGVLDHIIYEIKRDTDPDWSSPVSSKTSYCWYASVGDIHPIRVGENG